MRVRRFWKILLLLVVLLSFLGAVPQETPALGLEPGQGSAPLPAADPAPLFPQADRGKSGADGPASTMATTWQLQTVDSAGIVGYYTSIALDAAGRPHIGYQYFTSRDLKYAYYDGSTWQLSLLDTAGTVGDYYISLALDTAGRPHISYYADANSELKYAHYVATGGNCGPANDWQCDSVDSPGIVGWYSSLALDSADYPHVSYYDLSNGNLKYAHYVVSGGNCGPSNSWNCETVDSPGTVGLYTSLALGEGQWPHISYYDQTNGRLKYAYKDVGGWHVQTVDGGTWDVGQYSSLALDSAGRPHIGYLDQSNGNLKYARYVETLGNCGPANDWQCDVLHNVQSLGGYLSLVLDTLDLPHISYYFFSTRDLQYAYYVGTGGNCSLSAAWQCDTVDSTGDVGQYTSLAVDANFGVHISYYDVTNQNLKYASGCKPVDRIAVSGQDLLLPGETGTYTATYFPRNATRPVTPVWDNGTVGSTTAYSWTTPGVYTIAVTATNPCGQAHKTFTVTVCLPVEGVTVSGPTFLETGEVGPYTADYTPDNASLPVTLTWDNGSSGPTAVYSWALPGAYTVTVTATNACGEVHAHYSVQVCQPVEGVTVSGPTLLETGEVGTYTAGYTPDNASPPVTFTWDNGTTGPAAEYSWTLPGPYMVTVTATNACGEAHTHYPVQVCQPVEGVTVSGPILLETGEVATYTADYTPDNASPPVTLAWDNGSSGPTAEYSWALPGTYIVTVTATNACGEAHTHYPVQVCQPVEGVTVSGPILLETGEVGPYTADYTPDDASLPVTLTWDNGSSGPTAEYSWTLPGIHIVTVTATNACGEVHTHYPVQVCQPVEAVTVSGPAVLLVGEEGTYTAAATPDNADLPVVFTWDDGTVGPTTAYSWTLPGVYSIAVTATNPCGEVYTTFAITVCVPVEEVTVSGPTILLVGEEGTYTAAYSPGNADPPVVFTWDNGTVGPMATYSWTLPGIHTVTVTATNSCGEVHAHYAVQVRQPVEGVAITGPDILLVGEQGGYTAAYSPPNATPPVTLTWDNGTMGPSAVYSWTVLGVHTIAVTATNCCGTISATYTVTVAVCRGVTAVAVSGPDMLVVGNQGTYVASYSPPNATPPVTLTWDNGTVGPTASYGWATPGVHTVIVTATNRCGEKSGTKAVIACQPVGGVDISGPASRLRGETGTYTATSGPPNATTPITFSWSNGTVSPIAVYSWDSAGTHAASVIASNACGAVGQSFPVSVFGQIYLPIILRGWNRCYLGPNGFWETEPNNSRDQARGNGSLCSGQLYYGRPDDENDYFHFYCGVETVTARMWGYGPGSHGQIQLFDGDIRIGYDGTPEDGWEVITRTVDGGDCYLRIYTVPQYVQTVPYTFTVIFRGP